MITLGDSSKACPVLSISPNVLDFTSLCKYPSKHSIPMFVPNIILTSAYLCISLPLNPTTLLYVQLYLQILKPYFNEYIIDKEGF